MQEGALKKGLPIIFIHKGYSDYLLYSLRQAVSFNPSSRVILIGDESNDRFDFIEHYKIKDFYQSASVFELVYEHMSCVKYEYEFFCFARWFIVRDFVEANISAGFICLDSDVLVYDDFSKYMNMFDGKVLSMRNVAGAGVNYFSGFNVIDSFCDLMTRQYSVPENLQYLKDNWAGHQRENYGGICDMYMFKFFKEQNPSLVLDTAITYDNEIMEICINDDRDDLKKKDGLIIVKYRGKQPYAQTFSGDKIKLLSIHFQGSWKRLMYKFYRGDGLVVCRIDEFYREIMSTIKRNMIIRTRLRRFLNSK